VTATVGRASMGGVARGSVANLAGAVVAASCTFALTVVVTRGMRQADAGVFFSVSSLFLLGTSVGQLGTDTGLVYFLSRCRVLEARDHITAYLRAALRPVLLTGLLMAAAATVYAEDLARLTNPGHVEQATTFIRSVAWFIPLAGLENVALAATRGLGAMRAYAVTEQITRPSLQLLLVTVAVHAAQPHLLLVAWGAAYAPVAVLAWWWWLRLARRLGLSARTASPTSGLGREFWVFTAPRSLASVAQLLMQRLDIVLVGALAGAPQAAIYTAATRFVVAGQMGRQAVSLAAQPALAEALARGDRERARQVFQTSAAWLMATTWPLFLAFVVVGGPLLQVFGSGYESGTAVLLLLSFSMLVATGCGDVDSALIMAGKTTWSLGNMAVALGLNLVLDLWLIPDHGVTGAAIGWSVAIMTKNLLALVQVRLALGLHPFGMASAIVALLSSASFALLPLLASELLGTELPALVMALAAASTVYAAGLWSARNPLELDELTSAATRGGR
jgi:O-antigen/teichoic acid export membrane protein